MEAMKDPGGNKSKDFFFPVDGSTEWLQRADALIAVKLLQRASEMNRPRVLEIGVWKGGWTSVVLGNVAGATVVGIDPYPEGARPVRALMLKRLELLGLEERFSLHEHLDGLNQSSRFDLIHIDGNHSEASAWEDLRRAHALLDEDGVIVVDDISHKWLPGVASATFRYCGESDLRMFMLTKAKGYLARRETAAHLYRAFWDDRGSIADLRIFQSFQEMVGHPYLESSEVLGQPVLLVKEDRIRTAAHTQRRGWPQALYALAGRARSSLYGGGRG